MNFSASQPIPGYTGHVATKDDDKGGEFIPPTKSYIPGYMGYVPHIRSENMFGKTFGNLTHVAKTDAEGSKNFAYSQGRFMTTTKNNFTNQLAKRREEGDLGRSYPFKTSLGGSMKTTVKNPDEITEAKKTPVGITLKELKAKAYGI